MLHKCCINRKSTLTHCSCGSIKGMTKSALSMLFWKGNRIYKLLVCLIMKCLQSETISPKCLTSLHRRCVYSKLLKLKSSRYSNGWEFWITSGQFVYVFIWSMQSSFITIFDFEIALWHGRFSNNSFRGLGHCVQKILCELEYGKTKAFYILKF